MFKGRKENNMKVKITLTGCDDKTEMEMIITPEERNVLERLSNLSFETSTYCCMPTMTIEVVEE